MNDNDISELLLLDEEELQAQLGAALLGAGRGFAAQDEERFRRQGEKWFTSRLDDLRTRLCPDPRVQRLYDGEPAEHATDVVILSELLVHVGGDPIPTIVAALAVKYGLRRLCREC
ncbi:hypothetical protein [Actinomycetospora flava]|uniref:Methyltransferase family protein n=1 Tax=Actinomycetospora flava TaxID=3129232 RepID=A0ABU8M7F6_9PSEU